MAALVKSAGSPERTWLRDAAQLALDRLEGRVWQGDQRSLAASPAIDPEDRAHALIRAQYLEGRVDLEALRAAAQGDPIQAAAVGAALPSLIDVDDQRILLGLLGEIEQRLAPLGGKVPHRGGLIGTAEARLALEAAVAEKEAKR